MSADHRMRRETHLSRRGGRRSLSPMYGPSTGAEPLSPALPVPGPRSAPLRRFVLGIGDLVAAAATDEARILQEGGDLLGELIARDDWLPDRHARPDADRYQQYLLHCDSQQRFSVVSFVWGPGQATPIHDHRVWGLVGVLRGAERVESFTRADDGRLVSKGPAAILPAGQVDAVSPRIGDIHRVANAFDDRVSISIHVYGANIGAVRRATYDAAGTEKAFISGYADEALPNIWRDS
jgi:predicted metal-dependent enzyme (double-stranded beta helix superfamily)